MKLPDRKNPQFKSIREFEMIKQVGSGAFSEVHLAVEIASQKKFAIKVINFRELSRSNWLNVQRELIIHQDLDHPHIVKQIDYFSENKILYMVLELCPNKTLFTMINSVGKLSEPDIRKYFKQTCLAIDYLHDKLIVMRDIKPENILLDSENSLKICDFGWAARHTDKDYLRAKAGTYSYMSPEALQAQPQSTKSDIWSLGILLYELVYNKEPYQTEDAYEQLKAIKASPPKFDDSISADMKDLILLCCQIDETKRPSAKEILRHKFLSGSDNGFSSRRATDRSASTTNEKTFESKFSTDFRQNFQLPLRVSNQNNSIQENNSAKLELPSKQGPDFSSTSSRSESSNIGNFTNRSGVATGSSDFRMTNFAQPHSVSRVTHNHFTGNTTAFSKEPSINQTTQNEESLFTIQISKESPSQIASSRTEYYSSARSVSESVKMGTGRPQQRFQIDSYQEKNESAKSKNNAPDFKGVPFGSSPQQKEEDKFSKPESYNAFSNKPITIHDLSEAAKREKNMIGNDRSQGEVNLYKHFSQQEEQPASKIHQPKYSLPRDTALSNTFTPTSKKIGSTTQFKLSSDPVVNSNEPRLTNTSSLPALFLDSKPRGEMCEKNSSNYDLNIYNSQRQNKQTSFHQEESAGPKRYQIDSDIGQMHRQTSQSNLKPASQSNNADFERANSSESMRLHSTPAKLEADSSAQKQRFVLQNSVQKEDSDLKELDKNKEVPQDAEEVFHNSTNLSTPKINQSGKLLGFNQPRSATKNFYVGSNPFETQTFSSSIAPEQPLGRLEISSGRIGQFETTKQFRSFEENPRVRFPMSALQEGDSKKGLKKQPSSNPEGSESLILYSNSKNSKDDRRPLVLDLYARHNNTRPTDSHKVNTQVSMTIPFQSSSSANISTKLKLDNQSLPNSSFQKEEVETLKVDIAAVARPQISDGRTRSESRKISFKL